MVIAVFWLSASAAWANGLVGMKSVFSGEWIFSSGKLCETTKGKLINTAVRKCDIAFTGSYGGANVSVVSISSIDSQIGIGKKDRAVFRFSASSTSSCGRRISGSCTRRRLGSPVVLLREANRLTNSET